THSYDTHARRDHYTLSLHDALPILPAAGKERGIRAEQQPFGSRNVQRSPEHLYEIQRLGLIARPAIAARGIEIYVRAEIADHQGFPEIARAEVRNNEA